MKSRVLVNTLYAVIVGVFLLVGCGQDGGVPTDKATGNRIEKEGKRKKKDRKQKRDIEWNKVDMSERVLKKVKKRVDITPEQEMAILEIISRESFDFDSMSKEEFYYKLLEVRSRISTEVLTKEQAEVFKKAKSKRKNKKG